MLFMCFYSFKLCRTILLQVLSPHPYKSPPSAPAHEHNRRWSSFRSETFLCGKAAPPPGSPPEKAVVDIQIPVSHLRKPAGHKPVRLLLKAP